MNWWIGFVDAEVMVVILIVAFSRGLFDFSNKSRLGGGLVLMCEFFAFSRYESQMERKQQARLPAPVLTAGRMRLELEPGEGEDWFRGPIRMGEL